MITFYPGPSRLYNNIPVYLKEAYDCGILSVNHRSPEFMDLFCECQQIFREKLEVPSHYGIYFTSSATECWEIIAQSLVKSATLHLFNGAFGQKWMEYTKKLSIDTDFIEFGINETLLYSKRLKTPELVCVTHNETSNGTEVESEMIGSLASFFPESLVVVDATSSMGGVKLDFASADVWFASVQKCFGMPAGMAILICSPKAISRARELKRNEHYNSLNFLHETMLRNQTTYTPNVLSIYLLKKIMEERQGISEIQSRTISRASKLYDLIKNLKTVKPLISNVEVRSRTVLAVEGDTMQIKVIKGILKEKGITVGNGYGKWADQTLRLANFPAIEDHEIQYLSECLSQF